MNKQFLALLILGGLLIFASGYLAGHAHGTNSVLHLVEEYMRAPRIHLPPQSDDTITKGGF